MVFELLRAALGDRHLTFRGRSSGTLMAQQYAELFPRRVRALVAGSNMDHSLSGADFRERRPRPSRTPSRNS
ncbi:alpha/beta fold hydrolase [Embleya hyalina]|uniref:alpha/beta fold hydrolase n=1 Tax=Embleya hyalina TaxID=516124 RepID=UPI001FE7CF75|nr:alpha/beta fold hydrolase [Embleya hyalina]